MGIDAFPSIQGGFWTCTYSSSTHTCGKKSAFTQISVTFCGTAFYNPAGFCNPDGIAFDGSKNLWYVDAANAIEVELTKVSNYAAIGTVNHPASWTVGVNFPFGVVIDSMGNHWVVDISTVTCAGSIFKNGVGVGAAGDAVGAVTMSTQNPSHKMHLYVSVTNLCGNFPYPFIGDWSASTVLPSPFVSLPGNPYVTASDPILGISTLLFFTDPVFNNLWQTTDTK
jgi:hypothetical protein